MEGVQAEGGSKLEGRRVRSGWLATCPDDISRFMCVSLCVFSVKGGDGCFFFMSKRVCVRAWMRGV